MPRNRFGAEITHCRMEDLAVAGGAVAVGGEILRERQPLGKRGHRPKRRSEPIDPGR